MARMKAEVWGKQGEYMGMCSVGLPETPDDGAGESQGRKLVEDETVEAQRGQLEG